MAGLVPAIHIPEALPVKSGLWMAGTRPAMTTFFCARTGLEEDPSPRYIHRMNASSHGGSSEARRKKLLFRAARRGFKEVDLIFGAFAAESLSGLDEAELDQFEALLDAPDSHVYDWLRGAAAPDAAYDTPVFHRMKALCARKDPTWNV
jgi:antitoxin CptB